MNVAGPTGAFVVNHRRDSRRIWRLGLAHVHCPGRRDAAGDGAHRVGDCGAIPRPVTIGFTNGIAAQSQPADLIGRSTLVTLVGRQNMQPHLDAALERAAIIHGGFDDPWARATA